MSDLRLVRLPSGLWSLVAVPVPEAPARRERPRPEPVLILAPMLAGGATCR